MSAISSIPQLNFGTRTLVLLDAGHGGLDADMRYTTPPTTGKRFDHKDKSLNFHGIPGNSEFLEGVSNRRFARVLSRYLMAMGIPVLPVYHDVLDSGRRARADAANVLHRANGGNSIFISLHSNAGQGRGWEIFTTEGITRSDQLAQCIAESTAPMLQNAGYPMRGNTRGIRGHKEEDWDVLRLTAMPAVLIETLFFDTLDEAIALDQLPTIEAFCTAYANGIARFINL